MEFSEFYNEKETTVKNTIEKYYIQTLNLVLMPAQIISTTFRVTV